MSSAAAPRLETWCTLLFLAGLLLVLKLHLLPSLIAGLLVYALVHAMVPMLRGSVLDNQVSRVVAVTLIATVVIALVTLAGFGVASFLRHSGEGIPLLLQRMAEIIEGSREQLPAWLVAYIPDDADELQRAIVEWLQANAAAFQVVGTGLGRALAHILIGMVIGALLSLEVAFVHPDSKPLSTALARRAGLLVAAFQRVVFAQFWISTINTVFTGIFLAGVLPLFGVHLPFTKTLILITFVVGLIPILGNLTSNTIIFIVGLSQSLFVALGALAYLIAIHKLEYFLNARIVGTQIRARAWELLLAMLVMEAAFGIPGLVAAPIYYAYAKDELRSRGLL